MLLYQHLARCPVALQLFLDVNPDFWCLVPIKSNEVALPIHANISITTQIIPSPTTIESTLVYNKRLNALAKYLMEGIPKPPFGYVFSEQQVNEQLNFFRNKKDQLKSSTLKKNIDLFNAIIVTILPDDCSTMLCQFVLSLLVTHAECKLNETNGLINEKIHRNYPFRGSWCEKLVCRSTTTTTKS
jgi:hypothetical protein